MLNTPFRKVKKLNLFPSFPKVLNCHLKASKKILLTIDSAPNAFAFLQNPTKKNIVAFYPFYNGIWNFFSGTLLFFSGISLSYHGLISSYHGLIWWFHGIKRWYHGLKWRIFIFAKKFLIKTYAFQCNAKIIFFPWKASVVLVNFTSVYVEARLA